MVEQRDALLLTYSTPHLLQSAYSSIVPTDGRPDEKRMGRYAAAAGGEL